ncbi:SDR family NAD(P)-dependent oxidoreductase [Micromonospora peucetia]|uniref:SDR family NAD(P)-dependent oxidoreductase n=1 Tax=Micromonospora peucetia TaxID=47871 RepID=UPI00224FA463|nr:SDR family NAD(P)-dependent oxidoreductase [Micromonospora peucetia]MCX4388145.1 SDR family NAD(P)-dependent oxidoreductase [Micromonospora peucetia]
MSEDTGVTGLLERYGPWALVVGGSEGVGAAFAEQLARAGLGVVLVARKPEALGEVADRVLAHGAPCRVLALDLLDADATARIVEAVADLDLGLLVLNAGANTYRSRFVEADLARVQAVIDLNVTRPLELCRELGARLAARGRGGILVVGSSAGYLGHADISIYAAAKAFARIFTEGLWLELGQVGVDVLHLVLGLTATPAMERAGLDLTGAADPADVAAQGLAALGTGPVHVVRQQAEVAARRSGLDRAALVAGNYGGMHAMLGGPSPGPS